MVALFELNFWRYMWQQPGGRGTILAFLGILGGVFLTGFLLGLSLR